MATSWNLSWNLSNWCPLTGWVVSESLPLFIVSDPTPFSLYQLWCKSICHGFFELFVPSYLFWADADRFPFVDMFLTVGQHAPGVSQTLK